MMRQRNMSTWMSVKF